jgi:hypothetical protein
MNAPTNTVQTLPSRRIGLLLAALIAAILAAFALVLMVSQNGAQAQEPKTVEVQANQAYTPTGIYLREGARVGIDGAGKIDINTTDGETLDVPPNGIAGFSPAGLPVSGANAGALIGKIGADGQPFLVGENKWISSAPRSGYLFLGINDLEGAFTDNAGHFTAYVTVSYPDTKAPRVVSTVPVAGATGVAPAANVKAFFSEDMKASTINGSTFKLFREGSATKVDAIVSYNATLDKAVLNPDNALRSGVTYKAVVTTYAKDKAGNRLDQKPSLSGLQQKVWYFKVSS